MILTISFRTILIITFFNNMNTCVFNRPTTTTPPNRDFEGCGTSSPQMLLTSKKNGLMKFHRDNIFCPKYMEIICSSSNPTENVSAEIIVNRVHSLGNQTNQASSILAFRNGSWYTTKESIRIEVVECFLHGKL